MTALALQDTMPTTLSELFAPIRVETFADLLRAYAVDRVTMEALASAVGEAQGRVLVHFARGNGIDGAESVAKYLFRLAPAVKALDAHYWSEAMELTDVWDSMPTDRKRQWSSMLEKHESVPAFDAQTLQATFAQLLADRPKFFAERVDGVFRALSPDHVTNRPQGFRSRLIIARVLTVGHGLSYCTHDRCDYLRDLRIVIAAFMGRGEPDYSSTADMVSWAQRYHRGEWVWLDGNSWAIRVYNNGNAHIKLHDELVWRLNGVLAYLHPQALASEVLVRPTRRPEVTLADRVIPFPVVQALRASGVHKFKGSWDLHWSPSMEKHHERELVSIVTALGGVVQGDWARFGYDPWAALQQLAATGMIPDHWLHQYYPTPEHVAVRVLDLAGIQAGDRVLEPSAGTGSLAALVRADANLTCVEVAWLHCTVLRSRIPGLLPIEGDFLDVVTELDPVDRVVMNPPFNKGRWQAHVAAAAALLRVGGRLVSVLPAGAVDRLVTPEGCTVTWADRYEDAFPGASVDVVIAVIDRVS